MKVAGVGTAGKVGKASKPGKATTVGTTMVSTMSAEVSKSVPTHDAIAQRSYELYLARGGTHGHDVEDWLQAETELTS